MKWLVIVLSLGCGTSHARPPADGAVDESGGSGPIMQRDPCPSESWCGTAEEAKTAADPGTPTNDFGCVKYFNGAVPGHTVEEGGFDERATVAHRASDPTICCYQIGQKCM